jgi:predicted nucleic acid-binding protein
MLRGKLADGDAWKSLRRAHMLVKRRYGHRELSPRAWDLRHNVSFYDGLYVALAEQLGSTLLTVDSRLAVATGPRCDIELV